MSGPLADHLRRVIRTAGPQTIDRFMAEILMHPTHGYYRRGDRVGADGDFITAPEISQMFGELIGLWLAQMWQGAGAPATVRLVELGPGRGTLMRDALRAMQIVPGLPEAIDLHLVESNQSFRHAQADLPATWHDSLQNVPAGPLLVIANEFFDALPVKQWVRAEHGWLERAVGLSAQDRLCYTGLPAETPPQAACHHPGQIVEASPAAQGLAADLADRLARHGGAALIIDYGYEGPAAGDSLQALYRHTKVCPLTHLGEADITAHVDFSALSLATKAARAWGPVGQGAFLSALGIGLRAERLTAAAPQRRDEIDQAVHRLTHPSAMGTLFKVMALTPPDAAAPPGFADA